MDSGLGRIEGIGRLSYSENPAGEASLMEFNPSTQTFHFGVYKPHIIFSDSKITIGCKTATAEAFDELCKQWMEFRQGNRRRIVQ